MPAEPHRHKIPRASHTHIQGLSPVWTRSGGVSPGGVSPGGGVLPGGGAVGVGLGVGVTGLSSIWMVW